MLFKDLYNLVNEEVAEPHVPFKLLMKLVNQHHHGVGEIKIWRIESSKPNYQAHFKMIGTDRSSAYGDEFILAEIRYCKGLDDDPRLRRYALTKELMHVFDLEGERTNTKGKFINLMNEIQNQPLPKHASPMYNSEINTRWMAAIILFPQKFRDLYKNDYINKNIEDLELAEKFKVPENLIPSIMGDYYDVALKELLLKGV